MMHGVAADTETAGPSEAESTSHCDSVPCSANTDTGPDSGLSHLLTDMGEAWDFLCGDESDPLEIMQSDSSEPDGLRAGLGVVVPPVPPASRLNSCPNSGRQSGDSSGFHSFT